MFRLFVIVFVSFASGAHAEVPESSRSKAAIAKVTSALKLDVQGMGIDWGAPMFIRIFKEEAELEVWLQKGEVFTLFRNYPICHFSGELGPKLQEGDGQSPEGFYFVKPVAMNSTSSFYLSFNLGFPNAYDRARGRTGSDLMVHGECVSIGCYAMAKSAEHLGDDRNDPISEIWTLMTAAYGNGQPFMRVHALPFRLTDGNMARHQASNWFDFWGNLKEGYDLFEMQNVPPNVEVDEKRYVFN